jgi:hypothetical protein
MPSFYVVVTMLLLISLGLLGFAETFSTSLVAPPTTLNTVSGSDRDVQERSAESSWRRPACTAVRLAGGLRGRCSPMKATVTATA